MHERHDLGGSRSGDQMKRSRDGTPRARGSKDAKIRSRSRAGTQRDPSGAEAAPKPTKTRRPARDSRSQQAAASACSSLTPVDPMAQEVVTHPGSFASEQYRQLALRVSEALESAGQISVLVTSATRGEGKSTTASNLALATAGLRPDARIALVELDLRGPVTADRLGIEVKHGVAQVLTGETTLDAVIVPTTRGELDIVPAKPEPANAHDLFSGPALPALWDEIQDRYEMVIVDGPPALGFSDTAQLVRLVDRCIVVARPGVTRMNAIQDAVAELPFEKVLGVVTNASISRRHAHDAYNEYYGPRQQSESEASR